MFIKKGIVCCIVLAFCHQFLGAQALFQKKYGGTLNDQMQSAALYADSSIIMVGWIQGIGAGSSDIYVIKAARTGDTLWTSVLGTPGTDYATSVAALPDNGCIVAASSDGFGSGGNEDILVIRLDDLGNILWSTRIGDSTGIEMPASITIDSSNRIIVTGSSNGYAFGNGDACVFVLDMTGQLLWGKIYGNVFGDIATKALVLNDSNLLILGGSDSPNYLMLINLTYYGDINWTKFLRHSSNWCGGTIITRTRNSDYLMAGVLAGPGGNKLFVSRMDSMMQLRWTNSYYQGVQNTIGYSMFEDADSNIIIAGLYQQSAFNWDVFLFKLNAYGDTLYTRFYGNAGIDRAYFVGPTEEGYLIAGSTASFGDGFEFYLFNVDSTGNSFCNNISRQISVYSDTLTVVNVPIMDTNYSVSNPVNLSVTRGGNTSIICSNIGTNDPILTLTVSLSAYPNPSKGSFRIAIPDLFGKGELIISDVLGRECYKIEKINDGDYELDLKGLPPGLYSIRVKKGANSQSVKLLIQ